MRVGSLNQGNSVAVQADSHWRPVVTPLSAACGACRSNTREGPLDQSQKLLGMLLVDLDRLAEFAFELPRIRSIGVELEDSCAIAFVDPPAAGAGAVMRGTAGLGLEELGDVSHHRVIPGMP